MKNGSGEKKRKTMADAFRRGLRQLYGTDENQGAGETLRAGRKKKVVRAASVLACIVAFTTTYALILPAVTLESQPVCGQEEHIHTDACYAYLDADGATVDPAVAVSLPVAGDLSTDAENAQMTLLSGSRGGYYEGSESNAITETAGISDNGRTEDPAGDGSADMTGESGMASADGSVSGLSAAVDTDSNPAAPLPGDISTDVTSAENTGSDAHSVTALPANPTDDADPDASDSDDPDTTDIPMPDVAADAPETVTDAPVADAPQSVRRVLICGQEEHQHSVECYPAKSDASTKKISPKSILTGLFGYDHSQSVTVDGTTITAEYKEGVLPDGVTMQAVPVPADAYVGAVADAVGKENTEIKSFDITFLSDGQEVEPSGEVKITFQADFITPDIDPAIVHITDDGSADLMDTKTADDTITLKTDSFSVYAISYTVDFHWEVDGKTYDFSMPGGGFVSFTDLVEVLGIAEGDNNVADQAGNDDTEEAEEAVTTAVDDAALTLDNIEISEETRKFVEGVEKVEFSSPDLVWIGKVDEDTTVGQLKDKNELKVEYSAELTEAQIDQINGTSVSAGDWALISRKEFDTEESLTVTMKDGEVFTVRVTDAQIVKDYISASGETYTITVIYDDEAGIPSGSDLNVREIEAGTEEYHKYLKDSAEELGLENADGVSFARFFDIEIVDKDGKKVEPKTPVQVKIAYKDAMELGLGDSLSVVHFGDKKTEVITGLSLSDDAKEITYEQGSFSVTGTVVAPQNNGSNYMVLIKDEIEGIPVTFLVNNDGTLSLVKAEYNADGSIKSVEVDEPMTWTYKNNHLYHPYDAVAYNVDKAGSAFAYRYMNPASDSGLTTETIDKIHFDGTDQQYGRTASDSATARDYWNSTTISYDAANHALKNGNSYLGVGTNSNGSVAIVGNAGTLSNAAEVYFASPDKVTKPGEPSSGVTASQNVVNHIDISVSGSSSIDVPLAFGNYYSDANIDNPNRTPILTVSQNEQMTLEATSSVNIELDDMKRAVITTYQIDTDGSIVYLDDAFYITGYSQNEANEIGDKAPQVRIEGAFKTAKAMHGETDAWLNTRDSGTGRFENRLASRVYYSVSVTKPVKFTPKYDGQELYDESGKKIEITLDITMTASFDYWDEGNNCPPVTNQLTFQGRPWDNAGNAEEWGKGGYPNIPTTYTMVGYTFVNHNGDFADISGMDFVLGGNAEDADSKVVAIEITKMIIDRDGNLIPLKSAITQSFDVFGSSTDNSNNVIGVNVPEYTSEYANYDSYAPLHSKEMKIGTSGMGLVYDYEIRPGMYYIVENPDEIHTTITTADEEEWEYVETRIETEYVWRNDMYSGRHVSETYYNPENDSYKSIPEVAGNYYGLLNPSTTEQPTSAYNSGTWNYNGNSGIYRNGFLEFFVYNVYKPVESEIDITLKKVDKDAVSASNPETLKGATFSITKYSVNTFRPEDKDTTWGTSGTKTLIDKKNADQTYTLNGVFTFEDLTAGYYEIEETAFPAGYVKLSSNPTFKVEKNASNELMITLLNNPDNLLKLVDGTLTINVGNTSGTALPSTGGSGTILFTILGSILVILSGTGLILWRRRRFMGAK